MSLLLTDVVLVALVRCQPINVAVADVELLGRPLFLVRSQ
jgi:hypothetical protein